MIKWMEAPEAGGLGGLAGSKREAVTRRLQVWPKQAL